MNRPSDIFTESTLPEILTKRKKHLKQELINSSFKLPGTNPFAGQYSAVVLSNLWTVHLPRHASALPTSQKKTNPRFKRRRMEQIPEHRPLSLLWLLSQLHPLLFHRKHPIFAQLLARTRL